MPVCESSEQCIGKPDTFMTIYPPRSEERRSACVPLCPIVGRKEDDEDLEVDATEQDEPPLLLGGPPFS